MLEARREGIVVRTVPLGTSDKVPYVSVSASAKLKRDVVNSMGVLNRLHHIGGLWHEYSLIEGWSILLPVVSVALILIVPSKLYL